MTDTPRRSLTRTLLGIALIGLGLLVFAIRLQHDGAYAMPGGGNLFGGLGSLLIGGLLLWPGLPKVGAWIAFALTPIVFFPGLYAIMSEMEEVISLYATDSAGQPAELRLWIVDRPDGAWVGMPGSKATEHALNGVQHQMLRAGQVQCVVPVRAEDRATVVAIHAMKVDKYRVAQIASAIGLYPAEAPETSAALRLDPCPPG